MRGAGARLAFHADWNAPGRVLSVSDKLGCLTLTERDNLTVTGEAIPGAREALLCVVRAEGARLIENAVFGGVLELTEGALRARFEVRNHPRRRRWDAR